MISSVVISAISEKKYSRCSQVARIYTDRTNSPAAKYFVIGVVVNKKKFTGVGDHRYWWRGVYDGRIKRRSAVYSLEEMNEKIQHPKLSIAVSSHGSHSREENNL